jgi:hypothetical protein
MRVIAGSDMLRAMSAVGDMLMLSDVMEDAVGVQGRASVQDRARDILRSAPGSTLGVRDGVGHVLTQETREVIGDLVIALDNAEGRLREMQRPSAVAAIDILRSKYLGLLIEHAGRGEYDPKLCDHIEDLLARWPAAKHGGESA